MITIKNVTKTYSGKKADITALNGVNLHVEKGEIYGVIGASGAGKSTLIRCVNFLERPTSGNVIVDKQDLGTLTSKQLREAKQSIGMVFQHFNLLHSKSVFTNVAMPLLLRKMSRKAIKKRVNELLEFVGLIDRSNHYPDQLSGGQKQRVGIARALATQPSVLLCDEATSALDPQTTDAILQLLKRINNQYNITILMITHEMDVIRDICNKVAVLDKGKIVESGSVFDVFSQPKSQVTYNFVRSVMHDDIPESIYELIAPQTSEQRTFRIIFIGDSASEPLLSHIAKQFEVEVNVLFGNITELQGQPFGNLIVSLAGSHSEIEKVVTYIHKRNVMIREVLENVS